jgi:hypothetical protein
MARKTGTLHEDQCAFIIISRSVLLRTRNVSDKRCKGTHILCSTPFFYFLYRLWDNVGKYGAARQTAGDNIIRCERLPCWISKATEAHSEYFLLTPRGRVLIEKLTGFELVKKFNPHFKEPEGLLPHFKCPPPVSSLNQINPVHAPIPRPESLSWYCPPFYFWVFQVVFLSGFPTKTCIHLSYYKLQYYTVVKIINFPLLCCMLKILRFNCCIIFQLQ